MTDATPRPGRCPRCETPVTGGFKFCPACAFRLRNEAPPTPDPAPARDRWLQSLVLMAFGLLVVGTLVIGLKIFEQPDHGRGEDGQQRRSEAGVDHALTVRGDLLAQMETLVPAAADWASVPDPKNPEQEIEGPVKIGWIKILRYELTRGMYAEYVRACEADPSRVPASLRNLWRPPASLTPAEREQALEYAQGYVDLWWNRVREHVRETSPTQADPLRPRDLNAPLPERYDTLLIVPPSWIYVARYEDLKWELPGGDAAIPENLPVTDVSWYDAEAFAQWASDELELQGEDRLRLPTQREWMRAGRAGDLDAIYPWGNDPLVYACNSVTFWGEGKVEHLLAVDYRFSDADGRTEESVWGMSGNAAEWARSDVLRPVDDPGGPWFRIELPSAEEESEEMRGLAPIMGGSFRDGIEDCTVDGKSVRYRDKRGRWDDVGFRLWKRGSWRG